VAGETQSSIKDMNVINCIYNLIFSNYRYKKCQTFLLMSIKIRTKFNLLLIII
jgi:hypothetical protein